MYKGDPDYTAKLTLNVIAIADPVSQLVAVFIVPLFPRKLLLVLGSLLICGLNASIASLDLADNNAGVFFVVISLVVLTSVAQEPVSQLYMTEVSNNASLGLAHFSYFGMNIALSFVLPVLVNKVGPPILYYIFAGAQLVIAVIMLVFLRETAKLSDKDKKLLYVPAEFREEISVSLSYIDKDHNHTLEKSVSFHHFA